MTPGQGQSVRVAGVQVGKITQVELKNGIAVVTMQLDPKWTKKIDRPLRRDSSAAPAHGPEGHVRGARPGRPRAGRSRAATRSRSQNTAPDIDPDEILSAFDTDTRAYLQLLINGAGKGLKGHGNDLNQTFKALGPTYRDLANASRPRSRHAAMR